MVIKIEFVCFTGVFSGAREVCGPYSEVAKI